MAEGPRNSVEPTGSIVNEWRKPRTTRRRGSHRSRRATPGNGLNHTGPRPFRRNTISRMCSWLRAATFLAVGTVSKVGISWRQPRSNDDVEHPSRRCLLAEVEHFEPQVTVNTLVLRPCLRDRRGGNVDAEALATRRGESVDKFFCHAIEIQPPSRRRQPRGPDRIDHLGGNSASSPLGVKLGVRPAGLPCYASNPLYGTRPAGADDSSHPAQCCSSRHDISRS